LGRPLRISGGVAQEPQKLRIVKHEQKRRLLQLWYFWFVRHGFLVWVEESLMGSSSHSGALMSMSRQTEIVIRKAGRERLFTAGEFLMTFEPSTVDLLPNPEQAFKQDTVVARRMARGLGLHAEGDLFPAVVWALVYP
jgi:hypothetical protein